MQAYGKGGRRAMQRGQLHNLARLYWYTIEFGLVREAEGLRLFGAGIMSSTAESVFALEDPSPNRVHFELARVMRRRSLVRGDHQPGSIPIAHPASRVGSVRVKGSRASRAASRP